jgi:hypothetical protein
MTGQKNKIDKRFVFTQCARIVGVEIRKCVTTTESGYDT